MVVTDSRLQAVRYKLAFEKYIQENGYTDIAPLVSFSGTVTDPDAGTEFTEPSMNTYIVTGRSIRELELPDRFDSPTTTCYSRRTSTRLDSTSPSYRRCTWTSDWTAYRRCRPFPASIAPRPVSRTRLSLTLTLETTLRTSQPGLRRTTAAPKSRKPLTATGSTNSRLNWTTPASTTRTKWTPSPKSTSATGTWSTSELTPPYRPSCNPRLNGTEQPTKKPPSLVATS